MVVLTDDFSSSLGITPLLLRNIDDLKAQETSLLPQPKPLFNQSAQSGQMEEDSYFLTWAKSLIFKAALLRWDDVYGAIERAQWKKDYPGVNFEKASEAKNERSEDVSLVFYALESEKGYVDLSHKFSLEKQWGGEQWLESKRSGNRLIRQLYEDYKNGKPAVLTRQQAEEFLKNDPELQLGMAAKINALKSYTTDISMLNSLGKLCGADQSSPVNIKNAIEAFRIAEGYDEFPLQGEALKTELSAPAVGRKN